MVRSTAVRRQYFGTYFFRNRPQLRLIRDLANRRGRGSGLTLAFLGCSSGAELYSVLWTIRSGRPDLKVVAHAVDISKDILELARRGVYSLTGPGLVGEPVFARISSEEMREMFDVDRERNQAVIKASLKNGVVWHLGDAASPALVSALGSLDMVVANNFLCHMAPADAEAGLRNIARLVRAGGYLVVCGIGLDVRTRVARELRWRPLREFLEEIHEGDPSVRRDWPWKYWGLEPLDKKRPDWQLLYAAVFQVSAGGRSPRRAEVPELMTPERLSILCVSPLPPSPPRFGSQARMHGVMTHLARHHDVSAISVIDGGFDAEECCRAMREYCRDVVLVPSPSGPDGATKRLLQLRSLVSRQSFERRLHSVSALQPALDRMLRRTRFDVVNLEFPYLAHFAYRQSPPGAPPPLLVLDAHEVAYDLARQLARRSASLGRRIYGELNWRKLRREERAAFRMVDGICACSTTDRARILADAPWARTAVIPNAADVDYYQPRSADPPSDGRTVLFFGLLSTVPNVDGIRFFIREIWPRIAAHRPEARCKIVGARPHSSVLELAGSRVEVVGFVHDLRSHLASAAALVVPLRLGGGTRLKIIEGMAMARPIVSTSLGAEGIDATPERDILIADDPARFAASVIRLLDDPLLGARLGRAARELAVERYSWSAAASTLDRFLGELRARCIPARPGQSADFSGTPIGRGA